ncbi:MAG: acetate kinase [Ruminococcaceae bacterium]|nr:acetate kinase [Oscillospiraceae bacterium]
MNVLVVNAGSSSLKYQLIDTLSGDVKCKGICERIGIDGSLIEHKINGEKYTNQCDMPNHSVAMKIVVDTLCDAKIGCIKDVSEIEAIGHRVVHGGPYFFESCLVTPEVIEKLKLCYDFAPLHTPAHLMGIEGCTAVMPTTPQVLVFDTAFHQTMPEKAYMYPLSYDMYDDYKIRRYGAHGTSHRFVSGIMNDILAKKGVTGDTKIVTCHIGNGSSISAVRGGKVVDTSMGFTPLEGVEMGTRCGSIDPAIVPYMMQKKGWSADEVASYMNKKCGFLGLTGKSDSRDLEDAVANGPSDPLYEKANLATSILFYQIKKYIGSYTAAMGGLDAIVFTAGLGENNTRLREMVCEDMEFFGVKIDKDVNAKALRQSDIIKLSTDDSKVDVYLIPTNEELVIAQDTAAIVSAL